MTKIIIIEKVGTLKVLNVKDFSEDTLYKKAGLKSNEGFCLQYTWGPDDGIDHSIRLYAKKTGRAGQENKYDFPPPVDKTLFFGGCVLVRRKGDEVLNLTAKEWDKIYEHLFGGFEDIGDEDSEYVSDDDLSADVPLTKNGYVKDGFVVDDDYENEEDDVYSSEEERPVVKKTPKSALKTSKTTTTKSKSKSQVTIHPEENVKLAMDTTTTITQTVEDTTYLGCTNELEEEPYV